MSATLMQDSNGNQGVLYVSFELGWTKWVLGFSDGLGQKVWRRTIEARDLIGLHEKIAQAKRRLKLDPAAPVRSCYEAGRDGFWLHRYLSAQGIENQVVDSSSIEVNRRKRRAKSDGLDAAKLTTMLCRWWLGERKVWSVVRAPSVRQEDDRQLHRELAALQGERTRHVNRIRGMLAGVGLSVKLINAKLPQALAQLRTWDDLRLTEAFPALHARLLREHERMTLVQGQMNQLEKQRRQAIRQADPSAMRQVRTLLSLRGIGESGAWMYAREIGWREIENRRQLGGLSGLCASPYQSGEGHREQGISKAGNRRLRAMMLQLAWGWLRFQPDSELSRWYQQRFAEGGKRLRKIGIVALARKLLIALWRYVQTGQPPSGATVVAWQTKLT